MNEQITVVRCSGESCNTFSISGNNILVPVLFGIAIGLLLSSRS